MKGRVLATANWSWIEGTGTDTCRLIGEPGGYMLIGHVRGVEDGARLSLDYVVRCDPDWHSTGADITGTWGTRDLAWRIARDGGWTVNGAAIPDADPCIDIDLGFTPATNLLPLRRLADATGPQSARALWLRWPEGHAEVLEQTYDRRAPGTAHYTSPNFSADLTLHPSGFVTHYPGGWEGTVDAP